MGLQVREKAPEPLLKQLPFGPLLRYWMKHGIGLPDPTLRRWQNEYLRRAIVKVGLLEEGPSDTTITKWGNGGGFPDDTYWPSLREALTKDIGEALRQDYLECLDQSWEKTSGLKPQERIDSYKPYLEIVKSPQEELIDYLSQLTEEENVQADVSARSLLHNYGRDLLSQYERAVLERRQNRYVEALTITSSVIEGSRDAVTDSLQKVVTQVSFLRQQGNIRVAMGEWSNAIADFSSARSLMTYEQSDDIEAMTRNIWALVGREMRETISFDAARQRFDERRREFGTDTAPATATTLAWNILISQAKDYTQGRVVFDEMREAARADPKAAPNVVTWSTLLNLAEDYAQGRIVFDEMREAAKVDPKAAPNVVTTISLATKVKSVSEADDCVRLLLNLGLTHPGLFKALISKIYRFLSGEEVLSWAFESVKGYDFRFPLRAFEPAIVGFRKDGRFDDALRIIMPFPHLEASKAFMRNPANTERSRTYFMSELEGDEPHHATYALFILSCELEDAPGVRHWGEKAITYPKQPAKRREQIISFLDAHAIPNSGAKT